MTCPGYANWIESNLVCQELAEFIGWISINLNIEKFIKSYTKLCFVMLLPKQIDVMSRSVKN